MSAQHLAGPGTFAGLSELTDEQWARAKEAIKTSSDRDKKQRSVAEKRGEKESK